MRLVLVALVAGTGCAQLFGIDETTGADANLELASAQVQRVSIGASVIKGTQDLSAQTAIFLQDDGAGGFSQVPGEVAGDTFTANVPGTPPVMFTLPEPLPRRLWALPARAQRGNLNAFEHPNPMAPFPSSQVMLSVTLPSAYVAGQTFAVQSVGAWMSKGLAAAELPAPDMGLAAINATLDYSMFSAMLGNPKARITSSDVTLLLRYTGLKLTGVLQSQFEQIDGPTAMTGTMTAVAANNTFTAMFDPPGFTTRYTAVRPGVTGLAMSWRVTAAPGWSIGSDSGLRLDAANPMAADTMLTSTFGNPFESLDWRSVFVFATSSPRTYMHVDGTMMASMTLSASMSMSMMPTAAPATLSMPAGLPITIRANQTALTTDGMLLPLDPTQPVVVDATVDRPTNTLYTLSLVEVGFDAAGTAITRKTILEAVTVDDSGMPSFRLPPELFAAGKSYYFNFRSYQGGFPDAANGDLTTAELPFSTAALDSAVFKVGML